MLSTHGTYWPLTLFTSLCRSSKDVLASAGPPLNKEVREKARQPFVDQEHQIASPWCGTSACILMSTMTAKEVGGGIASYSFASLAKSKTHIRRAQRKHTQLSYLAMKNRLLCLVRPIPNAKQASRLEQFRANLIHGITTKTQEFSEHPDIQPSEGLDHTQLAHSDADSKTDKCMPPSIL